MGKWSVVCTKCNGVFDDGPYVCPACGGQLDVKFDPDAIAQAIDGLACSGRRGMWRYDGFLPVQSPLSIVSLGEGDTPLIKSRLFKERYGMEHVYLKVECQSPTGSFKDRQASLGVSRLQSDSESGCLTASCGNAGAAAAAYCARAGRRLFVLASDDISDAKLEQILFYGGHVIKVPTCSPGSDPMGLYRIVNEVCSIACLAPLVTAHYSNPYLGEANKTIAYETCIQLGKCAPDHVFAPIGGGGLLAGMWKGFVEFRDHEVTDSSPRMVAVQPEGCPSLLNAWKLGLTHVPAVEVTTKISGVSLSWPLDGVAALRAVRESEGSVVTASDEEIIRAAALLGTFEGLFAEPAGAVSVAGLLRSLEAGEVSRSDRVVCLITGAGWKSPLSLRATDDGSRRRVSVVPAQASRDAHYVGDLLKNLIEQGGDGLGA
ncbi:MAG: pyridoxal-phosphate dependent enzyme [Bacillota bacterium]|jgi:threonine synthase